MLERGKLSHFAPGEGIAAGAQSAVFDDGDWLEVPIPGGAHRALIAAGQIPDPFYDRNETACAWMEVREWWYRIPFTAPDEPLAAGERIRLVCHGLDTFATLWLDGQEIGQHENMFRAAEFDVGERLRPGASHMLAIRFDPPLARIAGKTLSAWGRNPERTPMRKAQFGYGWDWGPRLPTIGVWRPIELRRQRGAALAGVHFATLDLTRDHNRAVVAVRVEAERFATASSLVARITLTPPDGRGNETEIVHDLVLDGPSDALDATAYFTIEQPQLWWTHDLGDPVLYQLDVALMLGNEIFDRDRRAVGIRTLLLDQSPDPEERGARYFRFVLNGVPIFARGANWIPCDSFIEAIPPERYQMLLTAARDANMTMLRVWGGGIYEHDVFYETCDRLGLLVWQDFMFACAMYPENDLDFVAEVDAEARYQIRRLRNHPCLALWCGNNENQWLHDMHYWSDPDPPAYGALYYDQILPAAVAELDGTTPYWPGSPYGGDDHNDQRQGNVHNWDVWHGNIPRHFGEEPKKDQSPAGVSYLRYAEDMGRFCSEFGMHAAPVLATLRRVIPVDQLYHHSPAMDWHNKDTPKVKGDNLMLTITGLPQTLEEYIDFSMIAQAEGLKFGIEHYRRRKPHCSGTLVWQLNDCWPVLSWSVLDYNGVGKAGYYYLKRVYNPVLASFKALSDGSVELWLTNDTLTPIDEMVNVRLATFCGGTIWQEERTIAAPANSSQPVARWNAEALGGTPGRYLAVRSPTDRFPPNRHFFAAIKDLERPVAPPLMTVTAASDRKLRVELTAAADAYAYFVHLTLPQEGTRFSDNYFDLEPGGRCVITVTNSTVPLAADDVKVASR
jgi:beta-mannosidase